MGALRGVALVFVAVLFFVGLLVGNVFLTASSSLDYENIQEELGSIIGEIIRDQFEDKVSDKNFVEIEEHCQNHSEFEFEDAESEYDFTIPCNVVAQGQEASLTYLISQLVEQFYYTEYDCEFWDCFGETEQPFFLISEKAHDYWQSKFYIALIILIVLFILIFLLVEKKANAFILAGILMVVSALPLFGIEKIFGGMEESFLQFLTVFLSNSFVVGVWIIFVGIVALAFGFIWKFLDLGFWIHGKFGGKKGEEKKVVKK